MAKQPAVQTFGKYQILERIATGGMAEIYKARLEGIGGFQRTFAIKRILPHLSQNADYVSMLVDEAKVAGLLSHANIVQILDLGQVDRVWYIAMEYVDGRDLGAVLRRAGERGLRLPVPHTAFVAVELLKGLEYAHQRQVMRGGRPVPLNIIHRDVSPPNVLISFQGEVKLTDFGIARASLKALETQAGVIKGRFDYMSPEQAQGAKDLDQRSDLFAVGVVLYEMLTGAHPFRAESELATLERVRDGKYPPVSSRNPDVPFTLETIVDRALRVDRAERFPSATAFKEALDKFFHDSGFIFTHATLAAYIRGLYPDEAPRTGPDHALTPPPLGDRRTPAPVPNTARFEETTDGPTSVIDQVIVEAEMKRQASTRKFGLSALGEDETIIRSSPLSSGAGWSDEQETVIKPSPLPQSSPPPKRPARPDLAPPPLSSPASEFSTVGEAPKPKAAAPLPPPAPPVAAGIGVGLALVLCLASALIGFFVGGAVAATTVGVVVSGTQPAEGFASAPRLSVQAPPGAVVQVDGEKVTGPVGLTPGDPHRVQVVLDGFPPWDQVLTLAEGEMRVIVVNATMLEKGGP